MGRAEPVTSTEAEVEQITKERLMEDLRAVVSDAEGLLRATADLAEERIVAARGKAEESLKAARAMLAEQEALVMARTKAVVKATENYVRDNPWRAVGIAAAAGIILGILARR